MFGYKLTRADKLIMLRSPLHTHTELQFSTQFDSVSFSATREDKPGGCRFKQISYSHPEYWDTVILPIRNPEEDKVYKEARRIEGQPYDTIGLASFASGKEIIHPRDDAWWCTESVVNCIYCIERIRLVLNPLLPPDAANPTLADILFRWFASLERSRWQ
jgi:hypothetical protein